MDISLVVPALVIGGAGALVAALVVWLFLKPILPSLSLINRTSLALASKRRALKGVSSLPESAPLSETIDRLCRAIEFSKPPSKEMIEEVTTHNLTVFGQMLAAAEQKKFSPPHSAVIEELFVNRREILLAYFEESDKFGKKKRAGTIPGWGVKEFEKKLAEINSRVLANQRAIEEQLAEFRAFIYDTKPHRDITYH